MDGVTRRGFFGLIGAAVIVPFLPKPKTVPVLKFHPTYYQMSIDSSGIASEGWVFTGLDPKGAVTIEGRYVK